MQVTAASAGLPLGEAGMELCSRWIWGPPRTSTGVGLGCGRLIGCGGRRGQAAQMDPSWTALRSLPGCEFPPLPGAGLETRWLCVLPACSALEGGAELDSAEPGAGGAEESRGAPPPPQDPSPLRGTLGSSLRSPAEGEGNEGFPPPSEKDLAWTQASGTHRGLGSRCDVHKP